MLSTYSTSLAPVLTSPKILAPSGTRGGLCHLHTWNYLLAFGQSPKGWCFERVLLFKSLFDSGKKSQNDGNTWKLGVAAFRTPVESISGHCVRKSNRIIEERKWTNAIEKNVGNAVFRSLSAVRYRVFASWSNSDTLNLYLPKNVVCIFRFLASWVLIRFFYVKERKKKSSLHVLIVWSSLFPQDKLRGDAAADPHRQRARGPRQRVDREAHHEEHPRRPQPLRSGHRSREEDWERLQRTSEPTEPSS